MAIPKEPWYLKIAQWGLIPGIMGAAGFAVLSISDLQSFFWSLLPLDWQSALLETPGKKGIIVITFLGSLFLTSWSAIGLSWLAHHRKSGLESLNTELEGAIAQLNSKDIDTHSLFSKFIFGYYRQLGLGTGERISIYKATMSQLLCIGRYSDNEQFRNQSTKLYSRNVGVLKTAWETGLADHSVPICPIENLEAWLDYQVQVFDFERSDVEGIRMKSRSFYGIRIKDRDSQAAIAVILFESLSADGLKKTKIAKLISAEQQRNMCHLIEALEEHLPDLSTANEEGF